MATHSSPLAWKIPWTEEPCRLQSMGSRRVRQDKATSLSLLTFMHWRRKWQPTPVFLPGESQGWGSLVGCRLWGHTELDMTEATYSSSSSMSIESVKLSKHLILCCPFLLLVSVFPSIRIFSNEWALHIRWPKYWSFSISPSIEYLGLISFRTDWFDFLAVQETLKSFLQHHSSKASAIQRSAFFMVQL